VTSLSGPPGSEDHSAPRPNLLRRLYDWTLRWAGTRRAPWALGLLAFAEASFFPVPPDVLLIPMCLSEPRRSLRYAALCTTASVLGGILGYLIGMFLFEAVGRPIISFYRLTGQFEEMSRTLGRHGFLLVLAAALTPIPYKVFTIASGVCHEHMPLGVVVAASIIGRGARFFALALLLQFAGARMKSLIDRYFNALTIAFVLLLVAGFLCARILRGPGGQVVGPPQDTPAGQPGRPAEGGVGMLSDSARSVLLAVARSAVEAAVQGEPLPVDKVGSPELQDHQGAFVTLRTGGKLRGCIGRFMADEPLWQVVREMAVSSATRDARFFGMQLRPEELAALHIEVSVLSPLQRIRDPLSELELGTHGVYVKRGLNSGCFLPQVATETGWGKEEFLAHCCAGKAGLPPDAWKDPATEVYVFTAEVLGED
jgi:AmmeMemoRadiSam system protein A